MSSVVVGLLTFCFVFGGAMGGMQLGKILPPGHLDSETRALASITMAVLGTMSALVIGFLISNANLSLRTQNVAIAGQAADLVRVDRLLRRYGTQADAAHEALKKYAAIEFETRATATNDARPGTATPARVEALERVQDLVLAFTPVDARQRWLMSHTIDLLTQASSSGWSLSQQSVSSIPMPFLVVVVIWLTILFASFGLFAPRHGTAIAILFLGALAVSMAMKIILDMDNPYDGDVRLSGYPIRVTLDPLTRAIDTINR